MGFENLCFGFIILSTARRATSTICHYLELVGELCTYTLVHLQLPCGSCTHQANAHVVSPTLENNIYVSLQLSVQNAVSAQPCVGKLEISLVLLNFLDSNCGW